MKSGTVAGLVGATAKALPIHTNEAVSASCKYFLTPAGKGLERSTAQGMTIVVHPDTVTHGLTPGVGGVDHFPAFNGDFPRWCRVASEDDDDD